MKCYAMLGRKCHTFSRKCHTTFSRKCHTTFCKCHSTLGWNTLVHVLLKHVDADAFCVVHSLHETKLGVVILLWFLTYSLVYGSQTSYRLYSVSSVIRERLSDLPCCILHRAHQSADKFPFYFVNGERHSLMELY
jgi:hypothetical protein